VPLGERQAASRTNREQENRMKILIAEDDPVSRRLLEVTLTGWGYQVQVTADGRTACQALQVAGPPQLALLDWMLPEMDGLEICRRVRSTQAGRAIYIILLTTRSRKEDVIAGLDGGADDYVTKPFDREELRARLRAGCRIVELQLSLAERMAELEESLARIKQLNGLLPICAWCKKVRDDQNYWQEVECYVASHSEAQFTHGICPACLEKQKAKAGL
jgi:sigma-B regulation protein RsbU (phosphoserine phosphatase)